MESETKIDVNEESKDLDVDQDPQTVDRKEQPTNADDPDPLNDLISGLPYEGDNQASESVHIMKIGSDTSPKLALTAENTVSGSSVDLQKSSDDSDILQREIYINVNAEQGATMNVDPKELKCSTDEMPKGAQEGDQVFDDIESGLFKTLQPEDGQVGTQLYSSNQRTDPGGRLPDVLPTNTDFSSVETKDPKSINVIDLCGTPEPNEISDNDVTCGQAVSGEQKGKPGVATDTLNSTQNTPRGATLVKNNPTRASCLLTSERRVNCEELQTDDDVVLIDDEADIIELSSDDEDVNIYSCESSKDSASSRTSPRDSKVRVSTENRLPDTSKSEKRTVHNLKEAYSRFLEQGMSTRGAISKIKDLLVQRRSSTSGVTLRESFEIFLKQGLSVDEALNKVQELIHQGDLNRRKSGNVEPRESIVDKAANTSEKIQSLSKTHREMKRRQKKRQRKNLRQQEDRDWMRTFDRLRGSEKFGHRAPLDRTQQLKAGISPSDVEFLKLTNKTWSDVAGFIMADFSSKDNPNQANGGNKQKEKHVNKGGLATHPTSRDVCGLGECSQQPMTSIVGRPQCHVPMLTPSWQDTGRFPHGPLATPFGVPSNHIHAEISRSRISNTGTEKALFSDCEQSLATPPRPHQPAPIPRSRSHLKRVLESEGYEVTKRNRFGAVDQPQTASVSSKFKQDPVSSEDPIHICIVPSAYPKERFTDEQMEAVENNILEAVLEIDDNCSKPVFNGTIRRKGRYEIVCQNILAKTWLEKYLSSMHMPWPKASLKIIPAQPDSEIAASALLPLCKNNDNDTILRFIAKQNAGLNAELWEVVLRSDSALNTSLKLLIDEESAQILKNKSTIFFKMGTARVELREDLNVGQKVSSDCSRQAGIDESGAGYGWDPSYSSSSSTQTRLMERVGMSERASRSELESSRQPRLSSFVDPCSEQSRYDRSGIYNKIKGQSSFTEPSQRRPQFLQDAQKPNSWDLPSGRYTGPHRDYQPISERNRSSGVPLSEPPQRYQSSSNAYRQPATEEYNRRRYYRIPSPEQRRSSNYEEPYGSSQPHLYAPGDRSPDPKTTRRTVSPQNRISASRLVHTSQSRSSQGHGNLSSDCSPSNDFFQESNSPKESSWTNVFRSCSPDNHSRDLLGTSRSYPRQQMGLATSSVDNSRRTHHRSTVCDPEVPAGRFPRRSDGFSEQRFSFSSRSEHQDIPSPPPPPKLSGTRWD